MIKCLVIGDGYGGNDDLIETFKIMVPNSDLTIDGQVVKLNIIDCRSNRRQGVSIFPEEAKELLLTHDPDVVLVSYCLSDEKSYQRLQEEQLPFVAQRYPFTPIVVVATHLESIPLRHLDASVLKYLRESVLSKPNVYQHVFVSVKSGNFNVSLTMEECVRAVSAWNQTRKMSVKEMQRKVSLESEKKGCCRIL